MTLLRRSLRMAGSAPLGLATLLAVIGTVYAADVYKWTDQAGQVHYSDHQPSGQRWQRVDGGNISTIPTEVTPAPELSTTRSPEEAAKDTVASAERAFAQRREKLIQECEDNRGVDCARQVDTELDAQRIQAEGHVIHQARPAAIAPAGTAR